MREVEEDSDSYFLDSVTNQDDDEGVRKVALGICGKVVDFKIDAGADTSVYQKAHTKFC